MKTKLLCITMLTFTVLIFGANHYAARNEVPQGVCEKCDCTISLGAKSASKGVKEPSCSVVFKLVVSQSGKSWETENKIVREIQNEPDEPQHFEMCKFKILCDPGREAHIECGGGGIGVAVKEDTKCLGRCVSNQAQGWFDLPCESWARPVHKKKASGLPPLNGPVPAMFFASANMRTSLLSTFMPAKYIGEALDNGEAKEIVTGSTGWRLIAGEAGIENGMLMAANGEVEARSFCTGDTFRLVGPNAITLPICQPDVSGHWEGAYARPLVKGTRATATVSLNLRKQSNSVRGELTTPDGTFNIISGKQNNTDIELQAERTIAGTKETIKLNGSLTKGDIVFGGSEQAPDGKVTYGLTGFFRRLYIVDSALPTGILNQAYSFKLTADPLYSDSATFRLGTPTITQPEQITWNKNARDLHGHNGERFTYGCPAFTYINPVVYGTDLYTVDSSICKAAVHAGLISPKAGGVVTIQIKPDASSYTGSTRNGVSSKSYGAYEGSYVFVKAESNGGEPGRLPKGLSFDSQSGTFSGTPTELGSFDISVVADDGAGNVFEQPLTLTVKKLVVTNSLLPDGFVGQPYAATLKIAGGQPPYRFSGNPPKGLQLDPNTGEVSGKPLSSSGYDRYGNRTSGAASFEVTIRDSQNNSESQNVSLTVRGATIMNSHFLPDAKVGMPYRTQFQAVGILSPINWVFGRADAGSIGLALNEKTGELSGTPTNAGDFFVEVRAEAGSSVPSRRFALTIKPR